MNPGIASDRTDNRLSEIERLDKKEITEIVLIWRDLCCRKTWNSLRLRS